MSIVLKRIRKHYILLNDPRIGFSAKELTPEDHEFIEKGIIRKSTHEAVWLDCPECQSGPLEIQVDFFPSGKVEHSVYCTECKERYVIQPEDYERYEFDENNFLSYYKDTYQALMLLKSTEESKLDKISAYRKNDKRDPKLRLLLDDVYAIYCKRKSSSQEPNIKEICELIYRRHSSTMKVMPCSSANQLYNCFYYDLNQRWYG